MKLAIFDDYRLGVVLPDEQYIVDVTDAVPGRTDSDPFGAGWWVRLCRDLPIVRPELEAAAEAGEPVLLSDVRLRAPALNPSKVMACAINYAAHAAEMRDVILQRVGVQPTESTGDFDVFLKSTSSLIGPGDSVVLPQGPMAEHKEIHHESELVIVIGEGGYCIPESDAYDHILGYCIGLDITVRGHGDRSRRKSYDTFSPVGPWITTADEVGDPTNLAIRLEIGGTVRQDANTRDLLVNIPGIIGYASEVMTLYPGDIIFTGAPPGVGEIHPGEVMDTAITKLGRMQVPVRAPAEVG
jgi:2-keto-4-pentenoate hydratase/2-oxohepta-3-ene-1,7-dioic acid hydratase in catechol pathway